MRPVRFLAALFFGALFFFFIARLLMLLIGAAVVGGLAFMAIRGLSRLGGYQRQPYLFEAYRRQPLAIGRAAYTFPTRGSSEDFGWQASLANGRKIEVL